MQHVRLRQKSGASVRKYWEYNEREGWGRIPFPRRVAYLLLTYCYISIMAGVQRLYSFFKVFCGKMAAGFQSTGPH